jgi:hypothetical protein
MTDKNGKSISVGSVVKHPDGTTNRVRAIVQVGSGAVAKASECVVVDAFVGGKGANADGDTIVWGQ